MNAQASSLWDAWRTSSEIKELAQAWIERPAKRWTNEDSQLTTLFRTSPDRALSTLFAIMQLTDDAKILGRLGAGRFEEFLCVRGEKYLEVIHSLALDHKRFREVLDHVASQGTMSARLWQTIEMLKQSAFS